LAQPFLDRGFHQKIKGSRLDFSMPAFTFAEDLGPRRLVEQLAFLQAKKIEALCQCGVPGDLVYQGRRRPPASGTPLRPCGLA
jgi:hypothetical protein